EAGVDDGDVHLEVAREAPPVEVERSDRGVDAVDARRLRVQRAVDHLEHAHAGSQQAPVQVARGDGRDRHVADAGREDADVDTAARRVTERAQELRRRNEIRRGEQTRTHAAANGLVERALDVALASTDVAAEHLYEDAVGEG